MIAVNKIDYLNQRDPRWANVKIGNSDLTIAGAGCTLTCVCMGSQFMGFPITPAEMAAHKDWFTSGGWINWTKINLPTCEFRWREAGCNMPMIKQYLIHTPSTPWDKDHFVLLEVNHQHWVLALGESYGDIVCIDPFYGETKNVLHEYKNITAAVFFVRKGLKKTNEQPIAPLYE